MTGIKHQESCIKGRIAALLLLILAGCGKKEPAGSALETPEYQEWKGSQAIRQMASAGPAESIAGTVLVHPPGGRSKGADDFIELYLNGQIVQHTPFRSFGGATTLSPLTLSLRPGANWLDLWDSTTNRNYREQIDSRQGSDFVFTPTETGYALTWTKREP